MNHRDEQMKLVLFFNPVGRLTHGWRRPGSGVERLLSLGLAADIARRAEAARFDAVFISDKASFDEDVVNPPLNPYEPMVTLGALAAVTDHIGLIATISTTFTEPYNTARMLTQLDFLSGGRAGWNVVTSHTGDQNFTVDLPPKTERYERAEEFLEVCKLLWDGWAADAVLLDREAGRWADPDRITHANFKGRFYEVKDALTMPRSPQGRPVIVQAGQSEDGVNFAARHAEIVFASQSNRDDAVEFYAKLKVRVEGYGRDPASVSLLPGLLPIVAETEQEADDIAEELAGYVQLDAGLADISAQLVGADLGGLELDEAIPLERLPTPEEAARSTLFTASRYHNLYRVVTEEKPTLRELIRTRTKSQSHQMLRGTPSKIADQMQDWFDHLACDGFTITPPFMPEGLERVCDLLVPELQDRGLFRTGYPGETLRDTLS